DGDVLGNYTNVSSAIDEDAISGEEFLCFVKVNHDLTQKATALVHPTRRKITGEAANARVGRSETRTGERLDQIVNLFTLRERVKENGDGTDVHRESAQTQQMG